MTGKTTGQEQNDSAFVAGWSAAAAARLKAAIKKFGSQGQVAARAGISRQSLVEILRFDEVEGTGSRPRYKTLLALCDAINVDEKDIIGNPERTAQEADPALPLQGDFRIGVNDYSVVQRRSVDVSAGVGRIPLSEEASGGIAFQRTWLVKRGIASDLAALVPVKGDSMAPTIPDGSLVLMQFTHQIDRKGIYVFGRGDQVLIKRLNPLQRSEDGRVSSLAIVSDNPAYPPEVLLGDDVYELRIIGRVRTVVADV